MFADRLKYFLRQTKISEMRKPISTLKKLKTRIAYLVVSSTYPIEEEATPSKKSVAALISAYSRSFTSLKTGTSVRSNALAPTAQLRASAANVRLLAPPPQFVPENPPA